MKSLLLITLIIIGVYMVCFKQGRKQLEPQKLIPKYVFGNEIFGVEKFKGMVNLAVKGDIFYVVDSNDNCIQVLKINTDGSLTPRFTFGKEKKGLGEIWGINIGGGGLSVKDDFLYVADIGNSRIQVLKINLDGSLTPRFSFGKEGDRLGEFGVIKGDFLAGLPAPLSFSVKGNFLYVADIGNSWIQVLKINLDGSLMPIFSFGKEGKGLGDFNIPLSLTTKGDFLYVADAGNSRIQVLKINLDGSLTPRFSFGKKGKELGEFSMIESLIIYDNYLYVADTGNNRIQVLEIKY
ncbi:MAG: NHL repeat-containing protein [bacterium]